MKQLVMQKKENAKIREEIEFYERIIQEKEEGEGDEVDDSASNALNMQSKMSGGARREMSAANKQRSQIQTRGTNRSSSNVNAFAQSMGT